MKLIPHPATHAEKQFLPGPTGLCTLAGTLMSLRADSFLGLLRDGTACAPSTHVPLANAVCMPLPKLK